MKYFFNSFSTALAFCLFSFNISAQVGELNQFLKNFESAKTQQEQFSALIDLATYYEKKDSLKAMSYVNQALAYCTQEVSATCQAKVKQIAGRVAYYNDDYTKGISFLQASNCILKSNAKKELLATGYYYLASCYFNTLGTSDSASYYYKKAIALSPEVPPSKFIGWAYLDVAWVFENISQMDSAIIYTQKAVAYNDKFSFENGATIENLGTLYYATGNFAESFKLYNRALEIYIENKDTVGIFQVNKHLIIAHINNKTFSEGKEISYKNMSMMRQAKLEILFGDMYLSHARLFLDEKIHLDSADVYLAKALACYKQGNLNYSNIKSIAYVLLEYGTLHIKKEQYKDAENYLLESLENFRKTADKTSIGQVLSILSECCIKKGDFEAAKNYGLQAMNFIDDRSIPYLTNLNICLSRAYEGMENYKKALSFYTTYDVLKDSLHQQQMSDKTKERQWILENKNQEIALKEKENQLLKRELRIGIYQQFFAAFLIISLIILSYFLWQRKKQQELLVRKLESIQNKISQKEVTSTTSSLVWDNQFFGKTAEFLDNINKGVSEIKNQNDDFFESEQNLTKVVEELRSFNYMVSHDLKKPIQRVKNIASFLQGIKKENLDDATKEYLNSIKYSTEQMELLINSMLSFSQIDKQQLLYNQFSGEELLEELFKEYQTILQEKQIKVSLAEIPLIYSDRELLKRVFSNLIDNAIKFADAKKDSEIEVEYHQNEHFHIIKFTDNGIGFKKEDELTIFNLFQQLKIKQNNDGVGAGLAIAKRIMERLGGDIKAIGQYSIGAMFVVNIPINNG